MERELEPRRLSWITRFAALFLMYGMLLLVERRVLQMALVGVTIIAVLRALLDVYLMSLFAYVGIKGTRPPKRLFPLEIPSSPPLQISTWPKRLAVAGFSLAVLGLVLWNAEIRAGASEPPSLTENIAVSLFLLGLVSCLPLLFAGLAAVGSNLEKK